VFIILLGAAMLTAAFRAFGGEDLVREFLTSLPGGFWAQFIIVMGVIFILGFFLDFIEIAVVVVPIVAPILLMDPGANVTAVWLGVMIGLNIQTSFLTPPFGFALFYLRGVAPAAVRTVEIYKGVIPFIALQLIALVIVGNYPPLVNYLPTRMSLLAETAPPPRNPRLQYCIEKYVFVAIDRRGPEIRSALDKVKGLDLSMLPKRMQGDLTRSFTATGQVFDRLAAIRKAEAALDATIPAYRPLHIKVREIQDSMRRHDKDIKELNRRIGLLSSDAEKAKREQLERHKAELQKERSELAAQIPKKWQADHKIFADLLKADTNARRIYRRTVDGAYAPVQKALNSIDSTPELAALEKEIRGLGTTIDKPDAQAASEKVQDVMNKASKVEGAGDVRSALYKVRRELRRQEPDRAKAREEFQKAVAIYDAQMAWRKRAAADVLPALKVYEAAIRNTIGLRLQPRLPYNEALEVAACTSDHRDISLSF